MSFLEGGKRFEGQSNRQGRAPCGNKVRSRGSGPAPGPLNDAGVFLPAGLHPRARPRERKGGAHVVQEVLLLLRQQVTTSQKCERKLNVLSRELVLRFLTRRRVAGSRTFDTNRLI